MKLFTASVIALLAFNLCVAQQPFYDVSVNHGNGVRFWGGANEFKIHFGNGSEYHYGPVTDYSIKSNMSNTTGRGWTWGIMDLPPVAAINTNGDMQIAGTFVANNLGIGLSNPTFGLSIYSSENQTVLGGNTKSVIRLMNGYADTYGKRSEIQFGITQGSNQNLAVIAGEYASSNNGPAGDLVFGTNFSATMYERMRIKWDGKIGIGTNSPVGKVDISSAGGQLRLSGGTVAGGVWTDTADKLFLADWNTGSKGLMVNMTTGSVGIGTTNPVNSKLLINDGVNTKSTPLVIRGNYNAGTSGFHHTFLTYSATGAISSDATTETSGEYSKNWHVGIASSTQYFNSSYYVIYSKGANRFMIDDVGNVGIGTSAPDAKLAIKGTVHAQEVKVDMNVPGPDYVFEENYNLLSLTEIENYIKQNKHLPEVPAAKEMEANGINLSEMNMLLLKKVEELTLHSINQNKKIDSQEEAIKLLMKEMEELKTKIK